MKLRYLYNSRVDYQDYNIAWMGEYCFYTDSSKTPIRLYHGLGVYTKSIQFSL